jgi:hypothetical protein
MNKSAALPSRKTPRTETTICRTCFVAILPDQIQSHQAWHDERKKSPQ